MYRGELESAASANMADKHALMSLTVFADFPFVVQEVSSAPMVPSWMVSIGSLPIAGRTYSFRICAYALCALRR